MSVIAHGACIGKRHRKDEAQNCNVKEHGSKTAEVYTKVLQNAVRFTKCQNLGKRKAP